eukprot:2992690-Pleurochrysis_carterae.AAC.3
MTFPSHRTSSLGLPADAPCGARVRAHRHEVALVECLRALVDHADDRAKLAASEHQVLALAGSRPLVHVEALREHAVERCAHGITQTTRCEQLKRSCQSGGKLYAGPPTTQSPTLVSTLYKHKSPQKNSPTETQSRANTPTPFPEVRSTHAST